MSKMFPLLNTFIRCPRHFPSMRIPASFGGNFNESVTFQRSEDAKSSTRTRGTSFWDSLINQWVGVTLPCSVGYFLAVSHILLMYNIWHVRSLCMHRCKLNSKHEDVPPSFHRIQQALYPSAFSFFLNLSHFILIPPVCFFNHPSLCVFLSLLPICSCLCCCLMLCLSVSLRISDLSCVKSSLHLDFKSSMGTGLWGEGGVKGVRDRRSAVLGKSLLKESEKIRKESKGWVHEARHVCAPAGFKRRHFNRLWPEVKLLFVN